MISLYGFEATAVIFDCDGVLVDSEPRSAEAWRRALAGFGVEADRFDSWVGRTDAEIAAHYSQVTGRDAGEIAEAATWELEGLLAAGVPTFPDAVGLLTRVQRSGTPTAVASNSDRRRLGLVMTAAGLDGRVQIQVSSSDVPRPKPAPDIYRRVAEVLAVSPERCLVVEDSPSGISAARAAGMFVVAVDRGHFPVDALGSADRLVTDLAAE